MDWGIDFFLYMALFETRPFSLSQGPADEMKATSTRIHVNPQAVWLSSCSLSLGPRTCFPQDVLQEVF